jgi:signal transduction histidine kinase
MLTGTSLGYLGAATNFLLWFRVPFPPILNVLIPIYPISVAYAIVKHRLMDIEVIIRKGIIYSLLISVVAAVYALIVFGLQALLRNFMPVNEWVLTLLAAIAIAAGFKPLEELITNATDKIFFKKKYNYQNALREISGAMVHLTSLDRLVELIVKIVVRVMRLEGGLALVLDERSQRFVVAAAIKNVADLKGVSISSNYAILEEIHKTSDLILREDIVGRLNASNLVEEERRRLTMVKEEIDKFKAVVLVPTFSKTKAMGSKLIGVLSLGEKKSQDAFSDEDLDLLRTLANQAAVALENSILYDEQVKGRDILMKAEKMAALGTMAAGIVHELKNPLAFMQTVVQMMPSKWEDLEFKETTIKVLPEEVMRMRGIVDSLSEYSRQHELKLVPVSLAEVIEKVLTVVSYEIRKSCVVLKKQIPPDLPLIMGDSNHLMQVVLNLVNNAVQAMRRGGTLTVKTENLGARVALKITDTGIGIDRARLKEIFNPFYTTKEVGTGLGLAIAQKIIEEHKGSIEVSSIVGEGTTFTVYLPVAASA